MQGRQPNRETILLPGLEGLSNGGEERYTFKSSNACWHLTVHSNDFFNVRKKGRHLSIALEMNLFSATTLLLNLSTSLMFFDDINSIIARTLSMLTLIPL